MITTEMVKSAIVELSNEYSKPPSLTDIAYCIVENTNCDVRNPVPVKVRIQEILEENTGLFLSRDPVDQPYPGRKWELV